MPTSMACLLVEAGSSGCAVEGHREQGQRIKVRGSDWDALLRVAVMETSRVAPPSGGVVVAVAVNVPEEDPAGMFTEAGTVSSGLLAETDTLVPPVGAWAERVTVQVDDAPASSVAGPQVKVETNVGATRVKFAVCEDEPSEAVMVAGCVVVMAPAVALKVATVLLAVTVIEAGTVSAALLLESPTAKPPAGAGWLRVTVQVDAEPEFTLVGLQARTEISVGAIRLKFAVCDEPGRVAVIAAD
jgi:hypothetical protein